MESAPPANQRLRISTPYPGGWDTSQSPGSVAALAGGWRVQSGGRIRGDGNHPLS